MAIVRWEPFRDLLTTQDRFNRLFNETFGSAFGGQELTTTAWNPPVDVYETDKELVMKAELPGIDPKNLRFVSKMARFTSKASASRSAM